MALEPRSPPEYNKMSGRMYQSSKSSKKTSPPQPRPSKRLKLSVEDSDDEYGNLSGVEDPPSFPSRKHFSGAIPDSEAESGDDEVDVKPSNTQQTDLEQALPVVKTEREAIAEYEAMRAAEGSLSSDLQDRLGRRKWIQGKSSIYVDAFNLALETVLQDESHLFDEAEMALFQHWRGLSYEAQYLYVRLFLRKTSAWHRINKLTYYSDIADLNAAIDDLLAKRELPIPPKETLISPGELEPPQGTLLDGLFSFAQSSVEHIKTLEEASSLLMLDELKMLAKEAKFQGKNKSQLLHAFRRTSEMQKSLGFTSLRRTETEDSHGSDSSERPSSSRDPSPNKLDPSTSNRNTHFLNKVLAQTGPCIRLTAAPLKLFERVHLVFYRSTEWTEKSLTTIILARISRRNFPEYVVSRSTNIFPSRARLLEFEASVRTQFRVDSILEFSGYPTKENLQAVLDIFEEVFPRWRALLCEERQKEESVYVSGEGAYLRRLSPAWVYTRIVHKGANILGLGKFKHHKYEHEILSELLEQRLFHASRRGAWYQRKALLEEHYLHTISPFDGRTPEEQKRYWKCIALTTCEQGLQDHLVHLIYHYDLQKRIMKLEKNLKIAKREQHDFGHVSLSKPAERTFEGIRLEKAQKLPFIRKISDASQAQQTRRGAKTIWLDPATLSEDVATHCSVEEMCLSHYRSLGWKGYHAESGVLRTLFALLFYDVLFTAYVPNVFQTQFQTCPLDLHTDAFVTARSAEVNARLAEIENGRAEELVREVWEKEEERRTCVVGLDWAFEVEDLCEIVRAFGGMALGRVMLVLAQEYAQRGGGVPDLFLWKVDEGKENRLVEENKLGSCARITGAGQRMGEVLFAEVKSENDRLSDTQRLWIHVLNGAGIKVELCNAVAKEVRFLDDL